MKPASFDYHRPADLAEAMGLLAELGEDAKPLAGGQSLVPLMNFRLARPPHLIDLNGIAELDYIRLQDDAVVIGSMTRQRSLERSDLIAKRLPFVPSAVGLIGHQQIRNRGTIGGSLAHADPAAELACLALVLDAQIHLASKSGGRVVEARDFFLGPFTTALRDDELVTEVRIQTPHGRWGGALCEFARRSGDFALVSASVRLDGMTDGGCERARLVFGGVGATPVRCPQVEQFLELNGLDDRWLDQAAEAAAAGLRPTGDIHASAEYRRDLARVLLRRALAQARRTGGGGQ